MQFPEDFLQPDPSTGSGILGESICSLDAGACYIFRPKNCMRNSCIGLLSVAGLLSAVEAPGIAKVAHGPFDGLRDPRTGHGPVSLANRPLLNWRRIGERNAVKSNRPLLLG